MALTPQLMRSVSAGPFAAVARDNSGKVIQPVLYAEGGQNYVAHIFTGSGTLEFSRGVAVEYLVVGGGGGGGGIDFTALEGAGGGGAGGLLTGASSVDRQSYTVTVGAGGLAAPTTPARTPGSNGSNSSAFGLVALGGGGGGAGFLNTSGLSGGSGGGGGSGTNNAGSGTTGQGNNGGSAQFGGASSQRNGGGGGGAGTTGFTALNNGGDGGAGLASTLSGSFRYYAGGGGGGAGTGVPGLGGAGGGGDAATSGEPNTGGGGGGATTSNRNAGAGAAGVVIVRYRRNAATVLWDEDALAYLAAVETADNAALELPVRSAINDFVLGCKADGIWGAIKASCILCGARTLAGALVPLVGPAPTNYNFITADYSRKTGLVGNGSTKYLDTNYSNSATPQDSNHNAVYVSTLGTGAAFSIASATTPGANHLGGLNYRSRNATGINVSMQLRFNGHARNTAAVSLFRAAGLLTISALPSSPPDSANLALMLNNVTNYGTHRLAFYSAGEYLELGALESRVNALCDAVGAVVP